MAITNGQCQWAMQVKPVRETVSHLHVSKCTVSCGVGMGARLSYYWSNVKRVAGIVEFIKGGILIMAGRYWCRLMGHWMPQSSTTKSWHFTCCHIGMLWATRDLCSPIHFVGRQLHTPQSTTRYGIPDSAQCQQNAALARQVPKFEVHWMFESSEAQVEMAYYSQ